MKIDVHNHVLPQDVLELLRTETVYGVTLDGYRWEGGNHAKFEIEASFFDPDAKLAELQANGLGAAVLSAAPPIFCYEVEGAAGEAICRAANQGMQAFFEHSPDRFRFLAHVPLQSPELAVSLLEEEAAATGCVGVEVGTSIAGARLDEPRFEVFWSAVEELGLPVLIHPDTTYDRHAALGVYYFHNVVGFPFETTLTIERLICAGVLERHPGLQVLLVHAGGFFPFQAGRLAHARTVRPELAQSPPDPWAFLSQIWFDVIAHDDQALSYLVSRVGEGRVVLGTDLPFDMAQRAPLERLSRVVDQAVAKAITEINPRRLFALPDTTGASQTGAESLRADASIPDQRRGARP